MFDSYTTLFLVISPFIAIPLMLWLILPRQDSWAANMWGLGSLMAGIGVLLVGLSPLLPIVMSHHLANTLVLGCFVCSIQSLRMSLGKAWTVAGWSLRMLLALVFYSALYEWTTEALRITLLRFSLGVLGLQTAYWAWRLSQQLLSNNAAMIAAVEALIALTMIALTMIANGVLATEPFMGPNFSSLTIVLGTLFMAVMTNVFYVGMVMDRAAKHKILALQAQQAALQTQLLNTQLTHLDRRGRMAIVSGSLAHELNQPLTAATMNAQMAARLQAANTATPLLMNLLDQIEIGVQRTVQILQRIRNENDLVLQRQDRVDLLAVLDSAMDQMAPEFFRHSVELIENRPPHPLWCVGDELGFSQVLINVLRNALEAMSNSHNRRMWLHCELQNNRIQLAIRDSGPGMPQAMIDRWGQTFQSSRPEGMGLGLAISREIVTRHQGQLHLRNHPDGGLEVVLTLPSAQEPAT